MPFPKTCKGCGCAFEAGRPSRQFHTRSCFAHWRERQPAWQAAKRRGRALSNATKRATRIRRYAQKAQGCATKGEAFYAGHREGYPLGWKRGERVGFAAGYEAALRDSALEKTA